MIITLIDTVSRVFPEKGCYAVGDPNTYANIIWTNVPVEDIPSESTLEQHRLDLTKRQKVTELSEACKLSIIGGFVSTALGDAHIYDSDIEDQINLSGAFMVTLPTSENPSGTSIPYACRNATTLVKTYVIHTHEQMKQVVMEGAAFKLFLLQHFHYLRGQVQAAQTLSEVDGFNWYIPTP